MRREFVVEPAFASGGRIGALAGAAGGLADSALRTSILGMDELPRFPSEVEVIREQVRQYRLLSPSERMLAIFDLMASGLALLSQSPQREAAQRLRDEQEQEWKRIRRELFKRHAG